MSLLGKLSLLLDGLQDTACIFAVGFSVSLLRNRHAVQSNIREEMNTKKPSLCLGKKEQKERMDTNLIFIFQL
jgi:hypothetical protein